jgi:hypothetical protein
LDQSTVLPIISILILFIIDFYTTLRLKIIKFKELFNDIVDNFYTDNTYKNKVYYVYRKIIEEINLLYPDLMKTIVCLRLNLNSSSKLQIVNSSDYLWSIEIPDNNILNINEINYLLNQPIILDNKTFKDNLWILINGSNSKYIFIFITNKKIPKYLLIIGIYRILIPPLTKIIRIIESEQNIFYEKLKHQSQYSKDITFINKAIHTMHFINNSLGPLKNLIELLSNHAKNNDILTLQTNKLKVIIDEEIDRSNYTIDLIISRANYIMSKENNPYDYSTETIVKYQHFVSNINKVIHMYFQDYEYKSEPQFFYIKYNETGLDSVLCDWLQNITKYYNHAFEIKIEVENNQVAIKIFNNVPNIDKNIKDMIIDMMSENKNEIFKRTTKGLYWIKTILDSMNKKYYLKVFDEKKKIIEFCIYFDIIIK